MTDLNFELLIEMINNNNISNEKIINEIENNKKLVFGKKYEFNLLVYYSKLNIIRSDPNNKYELLYYLIKNKYIENLDTIIQYQKLDINIINYLLNEGYELDWKLISRYQNLDENMLEKFKYKLDWDEITRYRNISKYINENKFLNFVSWNYIYIQELTQEFVLRYLDRMNWNYIGYNCKLNEEFINKYSDKLNWDLLSKTQIFSDNLIEKFNEKINWDILSKRDIFSIKIIRKFENLINWDYIGIHNKYDDNFVKEFDNKINWYNFIIYQKLSIENIEKYEDFIPLSLLFETNILPIEYLEKLITIGSKNKDYEKKIVINMISKHPNLTEDFINKYLDKLNFEYLVLYQELKDYQIEKKIDISSYKVFYLYNNFDIHKLLNLLENHIFNSNKKYKILEKIYNFIESLNNNKEIKKFYWEYLSKYQELSEEYIEFNEKNLDWNNISQYQNLSEKILIKYYEKINLKYLLGKYSKTKIFSYNYLNLLILKNLNNYNDDIIRILKYTLKINKIIKKWKDYYYLPSNKKYYQLKDSFYKKINI